MLFSTHIYTILSISTRCENILSFKLKWLPKKFHLSLRLCNYLLKYNCHTVFKTGFYEAIYYNLVCYTSLIFTRHYYCFEYVYRDRAEVLRVLSQTIVSNGRTLSGELLHSIYYSYYK